MKNREAKFSGHQTFVARYGWLEKGYRFASDGKSFTNPEAIVELGVGRNTGNACSSLGVLVPIQYAPQADRANR